MGYCSPAISRKIRIMSFLAMITVVCIHSDPLQLMRNPSSIAVHFSGFVAILKLWAVPYFFMVSGFFFARSIDSRPDFSYKSFLQGKLRSLVLPYLIWGGIYGALLVTPLKVAVNRSEGAFLWKGTVFASAGIWNIINHIFGIAAGSPANGALWYVRMLILLFLLAPIWRLAYRKGKWLLPIVGLALVLFIDPEGEANSLRIFGIPIYFRWAALGYLFIGMFAGGTQLAEKKSINCLAGVAVAIAVALATYLSDIPWLMRISALCTVACLWSLYDKFEKWMPEELPSCVMLSFWIYCMHHPLTGYVGAILRRLLGRGEVSYWILTVAVPMVTIGICIAVGLMMKKAFPRTFKLLNGGR